MELPIFSDRLITAIGAGEQFVGKSGTIIKTLLGSCVAVCLYDVNARIIGINHFLLPVDYSNRSNELDARAGFYGVYAMPNLIDNMAALGANKRRIQSKIFGGGNVVKQLTPSDSSTKSVGDQNIAFIQEFLRYERIPVISQDVGGNQGRIIYFDSTNFSVYRTLIHNEQKSLLVNKEQSLYKNFEKQINGQKSKRKASDFKG